MKIKCPICHKIYDTEEANHYAKMHNDLEIGQCLTDLVFKIHEKIEEYKGKTVSDLDVSVSIEHLLKSIVED